MRTFLTAFIIATIASAILTPLVRLFALRIGAVSTPGGRHVHKNATPRLGGVAIFVGLVTPLIGLSFVESSVAFLIRDQARQVKGLLIGGALMGLVGVADDTRGVRARHKFYVQLVASAVAYFFGFRIDAVAIPGFGDLQMGAFALPVTMIWITGVVNAVNLIDGLDGLAAGVVFFAGLTNLIVAHLAGSVFVTLVMASLLGSLLGFLFYNFNPARIFMGDSGSYFLGYVLATTSLAGSLQKESTAISLLVPIVALGVPITDTLLAMIRRFVERRPMFSPDRGHIHHKLLDVGLTHRRAVMIIYGMSIVLTLAAIGLALGRRWEVGLAILAASSVLIVLLRFAGYSETIVRHPKALRDRDSERLRKSMLAAIAELPEARSESDIWNTIETVVLGAKMSYVELVEQLEGHERQVFRRTPTDAAGHEHELVLSHYRLGPDHSARYALRFAWRSDIGVVSPQCDALLQLLVDFTAQNLTRLGSRLIPVPAAPREASFTEEATAPAMATSTLHAK